MTLGIDMRRSAGTGTVTARGEIDLSNARTLTEAVSDLLSEGCVDVVMDLHDVTFIDSSGVSALVEARKNADAVGASFGLGGVSRQVRRVLQITALEDFLNASDDLVDPASAPPV